MNNTPEVVDRKDAKFHNFDVGEAKKHVIIERVAKVPVMMTVMVCYP